jgi:ABC-type sugar transport system ATPase subunit
MIELRNLTVRAGTFALHDIFLAVPSGQYAVLMGKTGSGKTTLLEAICGLRRIQAGEVWLAQREVTQLKPRDRGIGYVPQDAALFSTMTVRDHLAFALRVRRWSDAEIDQRVGELAELLDLRPLLDRRPQGLSGGETQRVALGRALACRPQILCLDEPLSALDDESREDACRLLKSVREHTHVTTLHVSHSVADAQRLADMVLLLKDGRVECTTPLAVLESRNGIEAKAVGANPLPRGERADVSEANAG